MRRKNRVAIKWSDNIKHYILLICFWDCFALFFRTVVSAACRELAKPKRAGKLFFHSAAWTM